jgi:hypothetical protein
MPTCGGPETGELLVVPDHRICFAQSTSIQPIVDRRLGHLQRNHSGLDIRLRKSEEMFPNGHNHAGHGYYALTGWLRWCAGHSCSAES